MMAQTTYALNVERLDDGTIRLEQPAWPDGPAMIDLHPAQVAVVAEVAGLPLWGDPKVPESVLRRLTRIRNAAEGVLALLGPVTSLPLRPHAEEREDAATIRRLLESLDDLLDDLEAEPPAGRNGNSGDRNSENSDAISVTGKPGKGRPASGAALSNAERQARHRARRQTAAQFLQAPSIQEGAE